MDEEPQKPSPKKVARTSKIKPPAAKVKEEEKPPKSTVSLPASNTYGATRGSRSGSLGSFEKLTSSCGLDDGSVPDAMSEKDLVSIRNLFSYRICVIRGLISQKFPLDIILICIILIYINFLKFFYSPVFFQGNEYFKEGKYVKAIECYSRSIALQPTAVAFANRAMALIKIRRS